MRREKVFFIDKNGNEISDKDIDFHEDLANKILQKNSELEKEFNQSGTKSKTTFLILKGYLCVSEDESQNYISTIYSSLNLTDATRNILGEYKIDGHEIFDIVRDYLEPEQVKQIKGWLMQYGKTEEVMDRINQEMFGWNKPELKVMEEER